MLNTDYTITIIEDDPLQLENLETALTEQGFQVKAFTERKPAEASFDEALPDLVISDIILGNEIDGGFELAKHLLSYERAIPVIFCRNANPNSIFIPAMP